MQFAIIAIHNTHDSFISSVDYGVWIALPKVKTAAEENVERSK